VLGNGAIELIQAAAQLVLSESDELITAWPSYSLYPSVAARAGARTVAVDLIDGKIDLDAMLAAVGPRSRLMLLCNPNDPTGTYIPSERLGALLGSLPEHVNVLLDEAFIQFQDVEEEDACMKLVEAFPKLIVLRTFSKIYGLSGIRAGYAVGSGTTNPLLMGLTPMLGVNALTQAAVAQALKVGGEDVARRRSSVIEQRPRIEEGLKRLGVEAPPSQANFIWMRAPGLSADELATRLEQSRVRVARGGPLGDDTHVRAAVRGQLETDRLLWALGQALSDTR